MSQQEQVKPKKRYRYLYWFFSFLVCLCILFKEHGETVVEHPLFLIISLAMLFYAPFWLTKAMDKYEEQVQEEEISAIDKQGL